MKAKPNSGGPKVNDPNHLGIITDLKIGPDGYLYILGYDGTIYRIT